MADCVLHATQRLAQAGIAEPRREARLLIEAVSGLAPAWQLTHGDEAFPDLPRFLDFLERRARAEPMAYLAGRKGFWTLDLAVAPDTLIPRGDTETLIETLLAHRPDRQAALSLLDFGTGTGCLLLAALSEYPQAQGMGVDRVEGAVRLARRNAALNGLADRAVFVTGSWGAGLEGRFDVILSNPPYIPSADIAGLMPDVARYEPVSALDGGADGLDDYRRIMPEIARLLAPDGLAILEIGIGQEIAVPALAAEVGLRLMEVRADLGGVPRAVILAL